MFFSKKIFSKEEYFLPVSRNFFSRLSSRCFPRFFLRRMFHNVDYCTRYSLLKLDNTPLSACSNYFQVIKRKSDKVSSPTILLGTVTEKNIFNAPENSTNSYTEATTGNNEMLDNIISKISVEEAKLLNSLLDKIRDHSI